MWRILIFCSIIFFACSCDNYGNSEEKMDIENNYTERQKTVSGSSEIKNEIPSPSAQFKKATQKILKTISGLAADSFLPCEKNGSHLFSLNDNNSVFSYNQIELIKNSQSATIEYKTPGCFVFAEEWTFADISTALNIENALTAPLADKTQERFLRSPFTFWRIQNRIYHLRTESGSCRPLLDKINEILTLELSPIDQ
jgi:hypothetical protein